MNCEACGADMAPFEICEHCLMYGEPGAPKPVGILEAGSYEDYRAAVRRQQERDRERFMGSDSHAGELLFDARTGRVVGHDGMRVQQSWTGIVRQFLEELAATAQAAQNAAARINQALAKPPKRHTYPRKHGEWWTRPGAKR